MSTDALARLHELNQEVATAEQEYERARERAHEAELSRMDALARLNNLRRQRADEAVEVIQQGVSKQRVLNATGMSRRRLWEALARQSESPE